VFSIFLVDYFLLLYNCDSDLFNEEYDIIRR